MKNLVAGLWAVTLSIGCIFTGTFTLLALTIGPPIEGWRALTGGLLSVGFIAAGLGFTWIIGKALNELPQ